MGNNMSNDSASQHRAPAQHETAGAHSTSEAPAQYEASKFESFGQYEALRHSCSDFDAPIPFRLHSSAWPIRRWPTDQDADELPARARKAGAL